MTRYQSSRGPDYPKAERLEWAGVPVIHRPGGEVAGRHVEPRTHLVDTPNGRSLVVTGGQATPLLVRIVRSTPRTARRKRGNVCEWQDVTRKTPGMSHQEIIARVAREWGMVPEEVSVAA